MESFKIQNLKKSFQINGSEYPVFRGLNLKGTSGEITVILGRSGCGKTTLLKVLCGLEKADFGTLVFPAKLRMVFQEPRLMPWLNTVQNINFGLPKELVDPARTAELVRIVGLQGFETVHPAELSGGMQHRAALARALACEPEMMLLDEPFAALDYFTRATMQKELRRIHLETRMGGIFVTHNIDEAILLGDHICIMSGGVIAQEFKQDPSEGERNLLNSTSIALKQDILSGLESETL
jgi:sulfonate transport system ATP-binding protein